MLQIVQMCFGEQFRGESRASRTQFVLLWFLWITISVQMLASNVILHNSHSCASSPPSRFLHKLAGSMV
jgi:hypothetical protein